MNAATQYDTDGTPNPKRQAMLIGNGHVEQHNLHLPGVAKDAENLSRVLSESILLIRSSLCVFFSYSNLDSAVADQ